MVTTTADFLTGNDEGMISFDTDAISRTVPSGGWIGSWNATTSFATARYGHTSVAYNGYLYIIGGYNGSFLNDVQVAPINTDGTVGTWNSTTSFATGRAFHTSVVYNGYLYVIGGWAGGRLNDVQFAPINADGTVGAWSATTSFSGIRESHTSVAYNGYLYVIGGYNGNFLNDVQYAPINANGTVGAWSTTISFTIARYGHTSVVYNRYLYVIGGYNSSGARSDIQFAPINTNGTIGAWIATTSLPSVRDYFASVAYKGYLYALGGEYYGGHRNDVQIAPINTNGTVGAWSATSSFNTVRDAHAAVAYNGYLYLMGGWHSSYMNDVQYAPINPNGSVDSWSATTSFTAPRYDHTSVVYNGYLYAIGGYNGTPLNDVQFAPINANGSLSIWTATTSFSSARYAHTSVAYNGYLYVIGGFNGTTNLNDVQFAPIHADGTVGTWTATTSFPAPRSDHASVVYNGYLYVIGGNNGSYLNDVQFAPINADGTVGTWTATTVFTTGRYAHASVVYGGNLYVIGGYSGSALNDVQFAPVNADGTLGAWTATTSFSLARWSHTSVAYNGYLYVIGGFGGTPLNDVQSAPIHADGTIGNWSPTTSFTTLRWGHTSVVYNGYLYVTGGFNGTLLNDVQFAFINASGTVDSWNTTMSFPTARGAHSSVAYNGYLYVMGGDNGSSYMNDVLFAPINANGTVGNWNTTTSFNTARDHHTSVAYNGYLYVIGGRSSSSFLNDVQFAPINSDGTIGSWSTTTSFNLARLLHTSVAYNGYLYVIGGYDGDYLNDVQFAPINSDGTVGSWSTTTSFNTARFGHTSVAYNGYLYVMGGWFYIDLQNDVQVAAIHSDGTVSSWSATTSFNTIRYGHTSIGFNGYLYVIGGQSSSVLNDVQVAPIYSDGKIASWSQTTSFAAARYDHASVAYNGNVYVIGGDTGYTKLNDVQYSTLIGPASRGAYSKLLDTGTGNRIIESLVFTSSSGGNKGYMLTYAVAPDSTGAFESRTTISNAVSGTTYTSGLGCARYAWVQFDFDDTNNATIDSGGIIGRKNLLDFTLTYNPYSSNVGNNITASKTTAVHLSWNAVSGATSYDIQRCDATAGPCTPATTASTTNLYYDDTVLGDGSSYWYQIVAVSACTGIAYGRNKGTE